ncbi:MAG: Response regulator consisting of a CheY-like receiver domain and a winged-helix DNA-binding domain [Bacillales bacterium]|jgi:two-component system alkaline phosphatase synthesis response regulator PhoP|nr:Response regulator consisting of a CheY-like receiver domain and a winged-helix DNA-binding domain [Bacillales bacterium]
MPKVFIVEDDENIRELVLYALKSSGFEAFGFENGRDFFEKMLSDKVDLVILDIMLPGEDGLSILKKLRSNQQTSRLPIIMLTAKGSEYDRVLGLDLGADDYLTKPFSILELISRIKSVLRRGINETEKPSSLLVFGNIQMDTTKHQVLIDNHSITLTLKEYELLKFLIINKGIVLTREKLMNAIWGFDYQGESRTIDMHIKSLRQKLESAGNLIKTIRGVGYKMGV